MYGVVQCIGGVESWVKFDSPSAYSHNRLPNHSPESATTTISPSPFGASGVIGNAAFALNWIFRFLSRFYQHKGQAYRAR